IEAAVESALAAADADPAVPKDRDVRLALLRRALIPWLAGVDPDTGAPRRRIARQSEIPAEACPLVQYLVDRRLVATGVAKDTGEITIEPTHEALLRQWGLLQRWLEEDFEDLAALEASNAQRGTGSQTVAMMAGLLMGADDWRRRSVWQRARISRTTSRR